MVYFPDCVKYGLIISGCSLGLFILIIIGELILRRKFPLIIFSSSGIPAESDDADTDEADIEKTDTGSMETGATITDSMKIAGMNTDRAPQITVTELTAVNEPADVNEPTDGDAPDDRNTSADDRPTGSIPDGDGDSDDTK